MAQPQLPKIYKYLLTYKSPECLLADTKSVARIQFNNRVLSLPRLMFAERHGLEYEGGWRVLRSCSNANCLNIGHYHKSRARKFKPAKPTPTPVPVQPTPCPNCSKYIDLIATLATAAQLFVEVTEEAIQKAQNGTQK